MSTTNSTLADRIQHQAAGSRTDEAAALIATQACRGGLVDRLRPWILDDPDAGMAWIDYRTAVRAARGLSGGERRLLTLAGSLATWGDDDPVRVNLADALTGLDDTNARIVADALGHALDVGPGGAW